MLIQMDVTSRIGLAGRVGICGGLREVSRAGAVAVMVYYKVFKDGRELTRVHRDREWLKAKTYKEIGVEKVSAPFEAKSIEEARKVEAEWL